MVYEVFLEPAAAKALEKIPNPARDRIRLRIRELSQNPRAGGATKLVGEDRAWLVRVGDYRILYEIDDGVLVVLVIRIGHRRDVYR